MAMACILWVEKWEVNWPDCFFMPQDLFEIQVEHPQKEDDYHCIRNKQSLRILMASGLRLTYMSKLDMHSVTLKVRDIQVWQPSMTPALVPVR